MRLHFALLIVCATGCCLPCLEKHFVLPIQREPLGENFEPDLSKEDATTVSETSVAQLATQAAPSKHESSRETFREELRREIMLWGPFLPFWYLMGWCPD